MIGRWVSRDPLFRALVQQGSAAANPYDYVRNRPVYITDPSGEQVGIICGIACGCALVCLALVVAIAIECVQNGCRQTNTCAACVGGAICDFCHNNAWVCAACGACMGGCIACVVAAL